MDIWQRGTSIALAASTNYLSGFSTDRWQTGTGANQAITISRQATSDTTNLPFIQYCARYQRNSGQTGTGTLIFAQSFESANSVPLAGRAVTFSFYARAGANYSAASSALLYQVYSGTGTDQNIFSGSYTGAVAAINSSATLTTTWQRFTATATLATNTNELAVQFLYVPVGTAGAADFFEVTGVQLELGSVATSFSRAQGTIQGELAACQRYYFRQSANVSQTSTGIGIGYAASATNAQIIIKAPQTMRIPPTAVEFSNVAFQNYGGASYALSGIAMNGVISNETFIQVEGTMSGATAGHVGRWLVNNNAAGYIGFTSEL
jgi:hypothetical protein